MKFILYKGGIYMAYEYKKLSEVEAIDVADSSVNLIVETEDKIKKLNIGDLPIGQEQADWEEEDETKASFIKNKPDLSQVGGSGAAITIVNLNSNYPSAASVNRMTFEDTGELVTMEKLYEALLNGIVKFKAVQVASSETQPRQEYYSVSNFAHYDAYSYTNMSGFDVNKPEKLVVTLSGTSQSYTFQ
jgi:hypothetical protein